MARSDDFAIFHRQGLISDREIRKAASRGAIGRRHLDEPEHQGEESGWGDDDLGQINSKRNARMWPKQEKQELPGNSNEPFDTNWYSAGYGRREG